MTEPRRILVVDDQQEILDLSELVLSRAGFSVETAASGIAALEALTREAADLAYSLFAGIS